MYAVERNNSNYQEVNDFFNELYPKRTFSSNGSYFNTTTGKKATYDYLIYPVYDNHAQMRFLPSFYEIVTLEQLKQNLMKKEPIKYKLRSPKFKDAVSALVKSQHEFNGESVSIGKNDVSIQLLKDASVLDIWFEPVYKEIEVKVGDYLVVTNNGCNNTGTSTGYIGKIKSIKSTSDKVIETGEPNKIYYFEDGAACSNRKDCTRLATEKEIEEFNTFKKGDYVVFLDKSSQGSYTNGRVYRLGGIHYKGGNQFYTETDDQGIANGCMLYKFRRATKAEEKTYVKFQTIKIGGYSAVFTKNTVKFGCNHYTKSQLEAYLHFLNQEGERQMQVKGFNITKEILTNLINKL